MVSGTRITKLAQANRCTHDASGIDAVGGCCVEFDRNDRSGLWGGLDQPTRRTKASMQARSRRFELSGVTQRVALSDDFPDCAILKIVVVPSGEYRTSVFRP